MSEKHIYLQGFKANIKKGHLGDAFDLKKKEIISHPDNGLSYALLKPPYGMRYEKFVQEKARELGRKKIKGARLQTAKTTFFNYVLDEIGLDIESENQYIIYSWSNDWRSYFESGKEWWGTFFWTILNKEKGEITVIGASTTD